MNRYDSNPPSPTCETLLSTSYSHLPVSHPTVVEEKSRRSVAEEERAFRECLRMKFSHKLKFERFKPNRPNSAFLLTPQSTDLDVNSLGNTSFGSFSSTPPTSALKLKDDRRQSEAKRTLVDTGDIDSYLKQMQRKHKEDNFRRNHYSKVTYHVSKEFLLKQQFIAFLRDEEDIRNDIEIVEIMLHTKLLETHHANRYSLMMTLQNEEQMHRSSLERDFVDQFQDLLIRLRSATEAVDLAKMTDVASPKRGERVASASPVRGEVRPVSSRIRKKISTAVDDRWIDGFLSTEENRLRGELIIEREQCMSRIAEAFAIQESVILRGLVLFNRRHQTFVLKPQVTDAATQRCFLDGQALMMQEDENLMRFKIEWLHIQESKRLHVFNRREVSDKSSRLSPNKN